MSTRPRVLDWVSPNCLSCMATMRVREKSARAPSTTCPCRLINQQIFGEPKCTHVLCRYVLSTPLSHTCGRLATVLTVLFCICHTAGGHQACLLLKSPNMPECCGWGHSLCLISLRLKIESSNTKSQISKHKTHKGPLIQPFPESQIPHHNLFHSYMTFSPLSNPLSHKPKRHPRTINNHGWKLLNEVFLRTWKVVFLTNLESSVKFCDFHMALKGEQLCSRGLPLSLLQFHFLRLS